MFKGSKATFENIGYIWLKFVSISIVLALKMHSKWSGPGLIGWDSWLSIPGSIFFNAYEMDVMFLHLKTFKKTVTFDGRMLKQNKKIKHNLAQYVSLSGFVNCSSDWRISQLLVTVLFYVRPKDFYSLFKSQTCCWVHQSWHIVGLCSELLTKLSYNIRLEYGDRKKIQSIVGIDPGISCSEPSALTARPWRL